MKKMGIFDLGTSSLKVSVFDIEGKHLGKTEFPYPTRTDNGYVVQYTKDWEDAFEKGLKWIGENFDFEDIEGFSFTGQMEDLILKDKAILYSDTSGKEAVKELNETWGKEHLYNTLGNYIDPMMPLTKLYALRKQGVSVEGKILLGGKDYLIYLLTGRTVTDPTNASTTGLYNIREKRWDKGLIEAVGLNIDQLPEIYPPDAIIGEVTKDRAKRFGIPEGIKVINGIGDAGASALGMNIEREGAVIYLGTTGWITLTGDAPPEKGKEGIFTLEFVNDKYLLIGAPLNVGKVYVFLSSIFSNTDIHSYKRKHLPIFLPYLSGERSPFTDPEALASWIGIDEETGREELIISAMEGVCFSLYHTAYVLLKDKIPTKILLTGGVTRNETWCKLFSGTFGATIIVPEVSDSPTLGAYIIGKKALQKEGKGIRLKEKKRFAPSEESTLFHRRRFEIYRDLYPLLKDTYHRLRSG